MTNVNRDRDFCVCLGPCKKCRCALAAIDQTNFLLTPNIETAYHQVDRPAWKLIILFDLPSRHVRCVFSDSLLLKQSRLKPSIIGLKWLTRIRKLGYKRFDTR